MHKNVITSLVKGFLLTRSWRDTANGVSLVFWIATDANPVKIVIKNQKAVCFVHRNNQIKPFGVVQRKPLNLKSLKNEAVDGLYFQQQRDLNQLREHL